MKKYNSFSSSRSSLRRQSGMTLLVLIGSSLLTFLVGKDFASRTLSSSQQLIPESSEIMAQFGSMQPSSLRTGYSGEVQGKLSLGGWAFDLLPGSEELDRISNKSILRSYRSASDQGKNNLIIPRNIVAKAGEIFELEFQADHLGSYVLRIEKHGIAWLYAVRFRERQPLGFYPASDFKDENYQLSMQGGSLRLGEVTLVNLDFSQSVVVLNTNLDQSRLSSVKSGEHLSILEVSQSESSAE